jgi:signal transduction histidine kinase/CheY-like chemotaxis protein
MELILPNGPEYLRAHEALLAKGEWQGEFKKVTSNGRELAVQVSWTLVLDAGGGPKSILAIDSDITEKKKLEAQFLRAQRMESIGTLAGGIAHDLNNVLAPIMMAVEMLKPLAVSESDKSLLDTLLRSTERGAELVKQVLSFARGVEGQRVIVNTLHLVQELMKVMRETFPKPIEIDFDAPRDLWMVTGDPTQMHQVILNLCVNARDAMPQGGKLTLELENARFDETYAAMNPDSRSGPYVMIRVVDTGSGIPAEIRERIFEPFFTTKEFGKGTGLGLSTTLAIVKSHGGFIRLHSEMGQGTEFKVYWPAHASHEASEQQPPNQARLPRGKGELILVVDDELAIREVARRTLENFGYAVIVASNGAEAISLYAQRAREIAAVFTDMSMPIMDGPALIIALRSIDPDVRIIGSSGVESSGDVSKTVGAKLDHYIPKPYTAEAMLATIRAILDGLG